MRTRKNFSSPRGGTTELLKTECRILLISSNAFFLLPRLKTCRHHQHHHRRRSAKTNEDVYHDPDESAVAPFTKHAHPAAPHDLYITALQKKELKGSIIHHERRRQLMPPNVALRNKTNPDSVQFLIVTSSSTIHSSAKSVQKVFQLSNEHIDPLFLTPYWVR